MRTIKIGMIGLDTSHVLSYTRILNDRNYEHHVPGGEVVVAFPGGSSDFELSFTRLEGFTTELRDKYHVKIVDSPEAVAEAADAILLMSVDGRVHLEQFRAIAHYGKPVFIDKPFATLLKEAEAIVRLAKQYNVPLMSCSGLRFAQPFQEAITDRSQGEILGVDTFGPMAMLPQMPGYFWYGIHPIEMLVTAMGLNCTQVSVSMSEHYDIISGQWLDGRLGTVRGNRKGAHKFGVTLHREKGSQYINLYPMRKPFAASTVERVMRMFTTGIVAIPIEETLHIVRFIEAANESRLTGKPVNLQR